MKDCTPHVIRKHLNLNLMVFRLAGCLLFCVAIGSTAQAGTAITETTGVGNLGTQVLPPSGNVYGITGGTSVGNNLYHSFAQFSVGTGDIVQFQTPMLIPNTAMHNILGRITDANPSIIFGTIDSATYYPSANLFLMNPYGFLFGPNAMVNVGGMAAFTTTDYLKLADDVRFEAIPGAQDALLSASPVAAFGFLGSNPAAIAVQGSQLTVANATGLSLVGGNRGFSYIDPDTGNPASAPDGVTVNGGRLSAPKGEINLAVTASPGEFLLAGLQSAPNINGESFTSYGSIHLATGSAIDAPGTGTVSIRGGQFVLAVTDAALTTAEGSSVPNSIILSPGSSIVTSNTGPDPGADVQIHTGNFQMNGAFILTDSTGAGGGGNIEITGANLLMSEGSTLFTSGSEVGKAGDIDLAVAGDVSLAGAGDIGLSGRISTNSHGSGPGGSITVTSSTMTVADLGIVETSSFGTGLSGNITIDTTTLNVKGGGVVQTFGSSVEGSAGNITISATEALTLVGTGNIFSTSHIANTNESGGTGTISIETGRLELSNQARIFNLTTFDSNPAAANQAEISVTADSINLSTGSRIDVIGGFISDVGRLEVSAQNLTMSGLSTMSTLTNGFGKSGPIVVTVHDLGVSEGSQIVSSSELGDGHGGDIIINASGSVSLTGQRADQSGTITHSGIFSRTFAGVEDPSRTGNAGSISITGQSIEVSHGAQVDSSSQSFALGDAGSINLTAPTITLNGGAISTSAEFSGQAGSIVLHANAVTLNNAGQITSNSTGTGNAGNIMINAGNQFTMTNSSVTTDADAVSGGNIKITTSPEATVLLQDSTISASVADGPEGGGNISIDPQFVILQNSHILAQAAQGQGGTITIITNLFLQDATSTVNADSGSGFHGTVTIQSPNSPISGQIQPLGKTPLIATALLNQRCASLAGGEFSSFTVAGRDSLPTEPGSWLSSPLYAAGVGEGHGVRGEGLEGAAPTLSLRQISPAGFLTQAFAVEGSSSCQS